MTPKPDRPARTPGHRLGLDALSKDPDYLALKEKMGEPLSAAERALLQAARSAPPPRPIAKPTGGA